MPGRTTYPDWLRKQPRGVVEDVLGETRAKLFLDGKLELNGFVDHRGGTLTLAELRAREAAAFKRAGVA